MKSKSATFFTICIITLLVTMLSSCEYTAMEVTGTYHGTYIYNSTSYPSGLLVASSESPTMVEINMSASGASTMIASSVKVTKEGDQYVFTSNNLTNTVSGHVVGNQIQFTLSNFMGTASFEGTR